MPTETPGLGGLLAKDRVFENDGKKCLVFTQYKDTAEYLYRNLKDQMEKQGLKISILTGKTPAKKGRGHNGLRS